MFVIVLISFPAPNHRPPYSVQLAAPRCCTESRLRIDCALDGGRQNEKVACYLYAKNINPED